MTVLQFVFSGLLSLFLAFAVHEGGHSLTAKILTGHWIKFHFAWGKLFGKIPIPRGVWTMPVCEWWRQQLIAAAGFSFELVMTIPFLILFHGFGIIYSVCAFLHFVLYRFYAGEASDFKWLGK